MAADVVPIFLQVPRSEIGYVKFILESYEGVAVLRTIDRRAGVLVVVAVPDFLEQALGTEVAARQARSRSTLARLAGFPAIKTVDSFDFEFNKKIHGLPYQFVVNTWLYNKTWFRQQGVAFPTDAWTTDDLLEAGKKLNIPASGVSDVAPK